MKRIAPLLVLVCFVIGLGIFYSCKKDPVIPTLTTTSVTNVTINSATTGGAITDDGGAEVTARGICWGTSSGPAIAGSHTTDSKGVGSFISNITGLTPNTLYHIRAYATNEAGTAYGEDISFTTTPVVVPTLTTTAVTSVTLTTAVSGGNITADGNAAITAKGVCWAATASPTVTNSKTVDGAGSGSFTSNISGLVPNTTYHIRAYATNSAGTAYGDDISFTTGQIVVPTLTTVTPSSVTLTSAVSGGNITADGGGAISSKGVCWAATANPTITNPKTADGTGSGSFVSNISGLLPNTTYHLRAYATNSAGTAYGNDLTFTTGAIAIPTLTTASVASITLTTAVSGGNITADGGGAVTARGACWSTSANPTISDSHSSDGSGIGTFVSNLSGLLPETTYHVRAYATNSTGTAYGNDITFTTNAVGIAALTTASVTSITQTTAVSGGNVTFDGGATITTRGTCWATTTNPTTSNFKTSDASGTGSFVSNLTGLTPGTTYYVRAYATNSAGTAYGNEVSFTAGQVVLATLTTSGITSITTTTATSGGNVLTNGGGTVSGRGLCWATTANPTISNFVTNDGSGTGSFVSNLTGLLPGTTYYVRAYAVNDAGTAYGNEVIFTTQVALPSLNTTAATSITQTAALSGGNITNAGGSPITARGTCWSITANPTIADPKTSDASGTGSFVSSLTGLLPGTTYHIRAYATNSAGTAYGSDLTFTTLVALPTLTTTAVTAITQNSATSGGNITADGGGTVTVRGVCWATTANPTTSNPKTTDGTGTGSYPSNLTSLAPGTIYHVRAYATNSAGTAYGNDVTFTTNSVLLPTVATSATSSITSTTAISGGSISSDGGGAITAKGACWSTTLNPTITDLKTIDGTGTASFSSNLLGLIPGTIYHVRAYATNSAGTAYGTDVTFTTIPTVVPVLTTTAISSIDLTTAVSGGNITLAGAGTITARGICWNTIPGPVATDSHTSDGTGTGSFTSTLISLLPGQKYYVRAYATNAAGTGYGTEISFNTKIADVENNKYNTINIGTQVWMTENLKTSKYNNGVSIPTTNTIDLSGEISPKYQWVYNNDVANLATYGRLYTFYAATDPAGVCPTGWHVPTDTELNTMQHFLIDNGFAFTPGLEDIGKAMAYTSGWTTDPTAGNVGNNQLTNNTSGFSALPAGFRKSNGDPTVWNSLGSGTYFRSSTITTSPGSWYYGLESSKSIFDRAAYATFNGYSIRCVK